MTLVAIHEMVQRNEKILLGSDQVGKLVKIAQFSKCCSVLPNAYHAMLTLGMLVGSCRAS